MIKFEKNVKFDQNGNFSGNIFYGSEQAQVEEHMNHQEIDDMMSQLPSQQPEESLLSRWIIGTMFTVFLIVMCMLPDIMR